MSDSGDSDNTVDADYITRDGLAAELTALKERSRVSLAVGADLLRRRGHEVGKSTLGSWCSDASVPAESLERSFSAYLNILGALPNGRQIMNDDRLRTQRGYTSYAQMKPRYCRGGRHYELPLRARWPAPTMSRRICEPG